MLLDYLHTIAYHIVYGNDLVNQYHMSKQIVINLHLYSNYILSSAKNTYDKRNFVRTSEKTRVIACH